MEASDVAVALVSELESGHPATGEAGLRLEAGHEETAFFLVHDDGTRFVVTVAKVGG